MAEDAAHKYNLGKIEETARYQDNKSRIQSFVTGRGTEEMREVIHDILKEYGFVEGAKTRIVRNINTTEGRKELMESPLWPGGPKWMDLQQKSPEALPELPPVVDQVDKRRANWDFVFTDYDPNWWGFYRWGKMFSPCWQPSRSLPLPYT